MFSSDKLVSKSGSHTEIDERALKSVKKHAEFFIDLAIQEYDFNVNFRPSVIAIAAILCARRVCRITPEWNAQGFEELTDYMYEGEIKHCADRLYKVYEKQFKVPSPRKESPPNKSNNSTKKNNHNKENQEQAKSLQTFSLAVQKTTLVDKEPVPSTDLHRDESIHSTRSDDVLEETGAGGTV